MKKTRRHIRDFLANASMEFFCESSRSLAVKPALIDRIAQHSAAVTGVPYDRAAPYQKRLFRTLSRASAQALVILAQKRIAVCLDPRLSKVRTGFMHNEIHAVFYDTCGRKIISLYDDGKGPNKKGYFKDNRADHSALCLNEFGKDHHLLPHDEPVIIASLYFEPGINKSVMSWKEAPLFRQEIALNPWVVNSPLRTAKAYTPVVLPSAAAPR